MYKKTIFINFFLIHFHICSKIIYIIPPAGYENEFLFDCVQHNNKIFNRDDCVKHFYDLRSKLRNLGHDLKTIPLDYKIPINSVVLTSGIPFEGILKKIRSHCKQIICLIWEPITIEPHSYDINNTELIDKIFTMNDDQVDNKKYFKLYYPNPNIFMIKDKIKFYQKSLLTMVASNSIAHHNLDGELYTERRNIAKYFSENLEQFVFYGRAGWNINHKSFGGHIESKVEVLKNYKFCICYENTKNMRGYISEKILDAFHAGCVPIYLGAPNISDYIPNNCFIDARQFTNYHEIRQFILDINESVYERYIINIENFLKSNKAITFSIKYFVESILDSILP